MTDYLAESEQDAFEVVRDVVATLGIEPPPQNSLQQDDAWDATVLDGEGTSAVLFNLT